MAVELLDKTARTSGLRFRDSWGNLLRITSVRVVVQTVMFLWFATLVVLTTFANLERLPGLRHWLSKFLEIDPLIGLATALATHTVYRGLVWGLVILIPTLFLGRFFCGWICPYGALHHFVGWLFGAEPSPRSGEEHPNRYDPSQRIKYVILIALLVAAVFGVVQIGLLDPLCLLHRSLTAGALPAAENPLPDVLAPPRLYQGAWLIGFLLLGLVAANVVWPRFFCRVLCPLGALLGLLGRFAWWRIERDPDVCRGCDRCRLHCPGACDPHARLRLAECMVCFNCIEECPENALHFVGRSAQSGESHAESDVGRWEGGKVGVDASARPSHLPTFPLSHVLAGPDLNRRHLLLAGVTGLLAYPLLRSTGRSTRDFSSSLIRPPGSAEELDFLARCVKCDQCARVCPTNVIQPAWLEGGIEGLWTPVLNFRIGHCQLHCVACGAVCPTGAIRVLSVDEKLGAGQFTDAGPLRLGTAHIDPARCLPHSAGIPCHVCEEVCPTSPKAIRTGGRGRGRGGGGRGRGRGGDADDGGVPVPHVDVDLCIGCGLCERECPVVGDRRGIYVTAEGETRSQDRPERDRNRSVRVARPPGQRASPE